MKQNSTELNTYKVSFILIALGIILMIFGGQISTNINIKDYLLSVYKGIWNAPAYVQDLSNHINFIGLFITVYGLFFNLSLRFLHKDTNTHIKRELVKMGLSIILSFISYLFIAALIVIFYHPNIDEIFQLANRLTIVGNIINPEPVEKLLYMLWLLTLPVFLFIFYFLFNKRLSDKTIDPKFSKYPIWASLILMSFLIALFSLLPITPYANSSCFTIYFQNIFPNYPFLSGNSFLIVSIIISFLIYNYLLYKTNKDIFTSERARNIINLLFNTFYSLIIIFSFIISMISFPPPWEVGHFNTVFYSMVQVFNGIPMLINGFTNTYGLYPHFLNPIFKLIGLNTLNFSLLMGLLLVYSYIMILFFLKNAVNNKLLMFMGFSSFVFMGHLCSQLPGAYPVHYFQYIPIRYVFPCTLLFLSVLYIKNRSALLYYASFVIYSIAVLWNPDTGIITILSWFFLLCYLEMKNKNRYIALRNILFHGTMLLFIFFATLFVYSMLIYLFYGGFPDIPQLFSTIPLFYSLGYFMLPMPIFHAWNLVLLAYAVGLMIAISSIINNKTSDRSALILLVSMVGIGAFTNYQGRSHDVCLIGPWCYLFLLLTLFADNLLIVLKKDNVILLKIILLLIISILTFSPISLVTYSKKMIDLSAYSITSINKTTKDQISENITFIKRHSRSGERIIILSMAYQGVYYNCTNTVSAFNPGFMDMFYKNDHDRLVDLIVKRSPKIFFATSDYFDNTIISLLDKHKKIDSNGSMIYYK